MGEGSALPVGVPVPWPSATPPTGWLKCNGAPFSAEEYPELAKVYPTNELPDLRGEFIRGWDDGRGVDSGRGLLSLQSSQNLSHSHDDLGAMGGERLVSLEQHPYMRRNIMVQMKDIRIGQKVVGLAHQQD